MRQRHREAHGDERDGQDLQDLKHPLLLSALTDAVKANRPADSRFLGSKKLLDMFI